MEDILFIINPVSACSSTLQTWARDRQQLVGQAINFAERVTSRAGEAAELTREALLKDTSRVIAVGGDGTLSEVVNGYLDDSGQPLNRDASVGLLPSGTGSDFRRSLCMETRQDWIRAATSPDTKTIDVARCQFKDSSGADASRFFINLASFGLGGDAVSFVNKWRSRMPGWIGGRMRYAAAAIFALNRYKNIPVTIRLDGEREMRISSNLMVVANGRFAGGGMMLAPNASLDDGLFDVILADGVTRLGIIKELPRVGRGGHLENSKVIETRAREVSIHADEPLAIDIDGEMVGYTPASLTLLPSVVRFAV